MSKNKEIFRIPTNDALTTIDVELSYQLGGHNPWSYANEKRGIYVSMFKPKMDESRVRRAHRLKGPA